MDRQYNGQKNTLEIIIDGQTIQWPKEYLRGKYWWTDNTMAKRIP